MKKIAAGLILALAMTISVKAENAEPTTIIEGETAKNGMLTSTAFGLEKPAFFKGGKILINTITISAPGNVEIKGIRLKLPADTKGEIERIRFIDSDEIPALFEALGQLIKLKSAPKPLKYTEYKFKTKSGMIFGYFIGKIDRYSKEEKSWFIDLGGENIFMDEYQFMDFATAMIKAQSELNNL